MQYYVKLNIKFYIQNNIHIWVHSKHQAIDVVMLACFLIFAELKHMKEINNFSTFFPLKSPFFAQSMRLCLGLGSLVSWG